MHLTIVFNRRNVHSQNYQNSGYWFFPDITAGRRPMKIPLRPPPIDELFKSILDDEGAQRIGHVLSRHIDATPGGKYRHWDVLRHLEPPSDLSVKEWWLGVKLARRSSYQPLPFQDRNGNEFKYGVPNLAYRMLHRIDRDAGGAIRGSDQITSPHSRDMYLLKSLVEEAITSSQLEGAATTREVAKEMLREGRQPHNRSERMIYNNYQAMQFIQNLGKQQLTRGIILEMQRILTEQTLDDPGAAGRLRRPDEPIHVVDPADGKALHIPPEANDLDKRLDVLCAFANSTESESFMHPVMRAILLHFALAYDHPFVDGNGRTARALFYWSMRAQGYWLCEFVSISSILRMAPAQYARAFLYTETDENDTTYFVLYQLRVLIQAIEKLHRYLQRKSEELRETRMYLQQSKMLRAALNHRQLAIINHALKNPLFTYSIESHRGSHGVSYQTARTDLLHLAELGLLDKGKIRRAFVFVAPADLHDRLRGVAPAVGQG